MMANDSVLISGITNIDVDELKNATQSVSPIYGLAELTLPG